MGPTYEYIYIYIDLLFLGPKAAHIIRRRSELKVKLVARLKDFELQYSEIGVYTILAGGGFYKSAQ